MTGRKKRMKGMWVPGIVTFIHGFVDGRSGAAVLAREEEIAGPVERTGRQEVLSSAYISNKLFLYQEYARREILGLEEETAKLWTEAELLLGKLRNAVERLDRLERERPTVRGADNVLPRGTLPASAAEAEALREADRKREAARKAGAAWEAEYRKAEEESEACRMRLLEIGNIVREEQELTRDRILRTASDLGSRFCTYAGGVFGRRIPASYGLPCPAAGEETGRFEAAHEELMKKILEAAGTGHHEERM